MGEEEAEHEPLDAPAGTEPRSPPALGLSLPIRSANVTVHQDEAGPSAQPQSTSAARGAVSSGANGLVRRDSLEDTKSFYGVTPTSPPHSHHSLKRPHSSASKATSATAAQRVRSSSLLSSYSLRSATSPPRTPAPLPTPRGFLSPKKPASAIRLEKKERSNGSLGGPTASRTYTSSLPTEYEDQSHSSQTTSRLVNRASTELISVRSTSTVQEENLSLDTALALSDIATGPVGGRGRKDRPGDLKPSASDWDRSIGRSVTEMSTPPRTADSELSSDGLVNRDKDLGTTEKGATGAQAADARSRRSWLARSSQRPSTSTSRPKSKSNSTRKRRYETFDNPLTVFFCGGRMMTGGEYWPFLVLVVVLMLGISGLWIATTGVWLWQHGTEYGLAKGGGVAATIIFVYLFGVSFSSLIASAIRDPGIIPRDLDPDPPWYEEGDWWDFIPRQLTVNDEKVTVKYCHTCGSFRPPRSSHCRLCGNCVDGIDHHCSYLHNCVGKRNYLSFLVTIVVSTIADIYIVVFSAIHFHLLCNFDNISFRRALSESPGAAVSFLLGLLALGPVGFLLSYHIRLLVWNLTTVEQIRTTESKSLFSTGSRPDNPFATGSILSNIAIASIGRPQFPSWIDASGWVKEEKRQVNPALKDLSWAREAL